ncbi:MAG: cyclic pyranopterin monophosphate synthase MoaC [Anaerolineaceae bacterium]|jgi:cyclic pyranopterin phosphate synthase|nr:cyclic pyranopterin monophosphate synthase MoaC [Anaerolineaceae bacterium]MDD4043725.1 cyclic pyranopterin monophosphate synthase MoaC [Anaerolineaceae bacterium]MDD4577658.1 cyclic pyranopterin monophosphate synthase MoaC [Anaerolineaceae bacterium]
MKMTHLDDEGRAIMVDISQKSTTERIAIASGTVKMLPETLELIRSGSVEKGDALAVTRVAGIMAAKKTAELIPLCHPLPLTSVKIDFEFVEANTLKIIAETKTTYSTGVEMEALTAVSVAALTIYDMCKAIDRAMVIGEIKLEKKSGGQSGEFNREELVI